MPRKVERTRNGGTMTEAAYWGRLRSHLRNAFKFDWQPSKRVKEKFTRPYQGTDRRRKKETQCQCCMQWLKPSDVQMHHTVEAGSLRCDEDVVPFITRLYCEDETVYIPLCKECHNKETHK